MNSNKSEHETLIRGLSGLACVLLAGTLGYHFIEGWSFLDGFYMTVITVTSIGFKEVHELSVSGQIFTLFIIASGIGVLGYSVVVGSRLLIEGEVNKILTRRRSMKAIEKLRDHFIICGFGRMGTFICDELYHRRIPFVVIESRPEIQDRVMQAGFYLSPGDATEEEVLAAAGIKHSRGLVSVLDSDASNVYVVLTARELNPGIEIIARAGDESALKKLQRAGASRVLSPYKIGGMSMVMSILKPTVTNFLEVAMGHEQYDIEIEEVRVSERSAYSGKRLVDTDIRKELNLIIIAVQKPDGRYVFNPGPYTIVENGDTLIAMGQRKSLSAFDKTMGNGTNSMNNAS